MPKPIHQRGFSIKLGNYSDNYVTYSIGQDGEEEVYIDFKKRDGSYNILITNSNEEFSVHFQTPQTSDSLEGGDFLGNSQQNLEEGKMIFEWVKKRLNIEENLAKYSPRFSNESELTLFNIMGIDSLNGLESFFKSKK